MDEPEESVEKQNGNQKLEYNINPTYNVNEKTEHTKM